MACDEHVRDMLLDYHLGHLSPEESEEVRRSLEGDPACQRELDEVARVLDLMPFAVRAETPPPDLKRRTLQKALELDSDVVPFPAASGADTAGRNRRGGALATLAAIAAVLVISLFGWAYLDLSRENQELRADVQELQQQGQQQDLLVVAVDGTDRAPEARGTAVVNAASGGLALDVYNLPPLPEGSAYRAWLVESSGDVVSLGEMETDGRGDGRMTGKAPGPLSLYRTVQVTTEPAGAEDKSGPVYLEASL